MYFKACIFNGHERNIIASKDEKLTILNSVDIEKIGHENANQQLIHAISAYNDHSETLALLNSQFIFNQRQ